MSLLGRRSSLKRQGSLVAAKSRSNHFNVVLAIGFFDLILQEYGKFLWLNKAPVKQFLARYQIWCEKIKENEEPSKQSGASPGVVHVHDGDDGAGVHVCEDLRERAEGGGNNKVVPIGTGREGGDGAEHASTYDYTRQSRPGCKEIVVYWWNALFHNGQSKNRYTQFCGELGNSQNRLSASHLEMHEKIKFLKDKMRKRADGDKDSRSWADKAELQQMGLVQQELSEFTTFVTELGAIGQFARERIIANDQLVFKIFLLLFNCMIIVGQYIMPDFSFVGDGI